MTLINRVNRPAGYAQPFLGQLPQAASIGFRRGTRQMRKRIIKEIQPDTSLPGEDDWLRLEDLAVVEVTSEDTAHPIESALLPNHGTGWRAVEPGKQTVRLIFAVP